MNDRKPILPPHIEETIRAIAQLHAEHHSASSALHRLVARVTGLVGRPRFIGVLTALVACWIVGNLMAPMFGHRPIDAPPFEWLETMVSLTALYITVLILTTQRRDDELAQYREQLTLELAILSEQKSAKIVELLEELRRDHPLLENRRDQEAEAMATPADPQSVLDAIKRSHVDMPGRDTG